MNCILLIYYVGGKLMLNRFMHLERTIQTNAEK